MKFSLVKVQDVMVIVLDGDIWGGWDALELKPAVGRLLDAGERKFVVDCSETSAVNSAGIGVLLAVQESIRAVRGSMKLCAVNERSRRAFAISEVWEEFETHPTRAAALQALGVSTPDV